MNELNRVAGNKRPDTKTKREKAPLRRVKPNVVNPSCFTHLIFFSYLIIEVRVEIPLRKNSVRMVNCKRVTGLDEMVRVPPTRLTFFKIFTSYSSNNSIMN